MSDYPEPCKFEPIEVTLEMSFVVCTDHGASKATGGIIRVPEAIGPMKVIKTALGVIEQTISGLLAYHPQIEALVAAKYDGEELSPRAKHRVMGLLANAYMQQLVAESDWERPEGIEFQRVGPD